MKKYIKPTSEVIELSTESCILAASNASPQIFDETSEGNYEQYSNKRGWNSSLWDHQKE